MTARDWGYRVRKLPADFAEMFSPVECTCGCVEFWDGDEWRVSMFTDRLALLDDMLGGGGTVREVLDPKELPDVQ